MKKYLAKPRPEFKAAPAQVRTRRLLGGGGW
jgi:hypothetical protein